MALKLLTEIYLKSQSNNKKKSCEGEILLIGR